MYEHHISRSKACQILGFSRSALYKPTVDWAAKDAPVIAALNEMVSKHSRRGFWKCFHRLMADGHEWHHKKVHRVYCAMKLNLQRKAKQTGDLARTPAIRYCNGTQQYLGARLHARHDVRRQAV